MSTLSETLTFLADTYDWDWSYAETWVREYKESLWLGLSVLSTLVVVYGIFLPQRNNFRQRKIETTLSLIDRWTAQGMAQVLHEYQYQVTLASGEASTFEAKTKLCSFFHNVALLIREQKVEEPLIRKSQIGVGFVHFYQAALLETAADSQIPGLDTHAFYGPTFKALYKRWAHLAKKAPSLLLLKPTATRSTPSVDNVVYLHPLPRE